jgi:hypothetical protein
MVTISWLVGHLGVAVMCALRREVLSINAAIRKASYRHSTAKLQVYATVILHELRTQGYEVTADTIYAVQRLLNGSPREWKGYNKIDLFLAADDFVGECGHDFELAFQALCRYEEVLMFSRIKGSELRPMQADGLRSRIDPGPLPCHLECTKPNRSRTR